MSTRVGIAELKAHLSEYVARAKAGERIVVCDRQTPVAELRATVPETEPLPIRKATRPWPEVVASLTPVRTLVPVDVVAMLRRIVTGAERLFRHQHLPAYSPGRRGSSHRLERVRAAVHQPPDAGRIAASD